MALKIDDKTIETTNAGFLVNPEDWNVEVARVMAKNEALELTERHWDVISYLRDEYFDNHANLPNVRTMVKALSKRWEEKISAKDLFELFPDNPSKQGGRIAGLPESKRKGGY